MTLREYIWLIVAGFIFGLFLGYGFSRHQHVQRSEIVRDTTVRVVTVYKDFPQPAKTAQIGHIVVPRCYFFADTLTTEIVTCQRDTVTEYVYLPREQKYYEEESGHLRMWVSGYDPRLDRYELDDITTAIKEIHKPPNKRWGLGITAGYGLSIDGSRVRASPQLSVGVTYNFITW